MGAAGPASSVEGRACPNCGGTTWHVAVIGTVADGAGFLDLRPAPMARCVGCGLSAHLDAEQIPWEKCAILRCGCWFESGTDPTP